MRLPQAIQNRLHNFRLWTLISLLSISCVYEFASLLYVIPNGLHITGSVIVILTSMILIRELKSFLI